MNLAQMIIVGEKALYGPHAKHGGIYIEVPEESPRQDLSASSWLTPKGAAGLRHSLANVWWWQEAQQHHSCQIWLVHPTVFWKVVAGAQREVAVQKQHKQQARHGRVMKKKKAPSISKNVNMHNILNSKLKTKSTLVKLELHRHHWRVLVSEILKSN